MNHYAFERLDGEWSREQWRMLDRALYRWVRVHGGGALLAATAAWASLADGEGDAALPLAGENRVGMPSLSVAEIDRLRAEPMVAAEGASEPRPFLLDRADRFYLWRNYVQERDAATQIERRRALLPAKTRDDATVEADLDALFHGERSAEVGPQREAVKNVVGRRLFVLTGGPGTGKTTTVLRMLAMLQRRGSRPLSIQIAAPTGKAAQRLVQALRRGKLALREHALRPLPADWQPLLDAIPDVEAMTVHRLLGFQPWRNAFRRNAADPIAADVVVVDEASMIDLAMLRSLLVAAKPETTLILVGDADQLTSVATGSVLMDIVAALEAGAAGDLVRLEHSFRAEQRQLVALNEAVRRGDIGALQAAIDAAGEDIVRRNLETPRQLGERLRQWTRELADDAQLRPTLPSARAPLDPERALHDDAATSIATERNECARGALMALARRQLLCALRETGFGALAVNAMIERQLRAAWNIADTAEWYAGRAVIVTQNDYAAGLFNGDVGLCLADESGRLRVWFESAPTGRNGAPAAAGLRSFSPNTLPAHETAFAITIHKSQGSEYGDVAVLLTPDADNRILSRQLLYTAVSRARRRVELWASDAVLRAAVGRPVERQGGLRERLLGTAARAQAATRSTQRDAGQRQLGFDFSER
jgi:exodeoxyribonuclease V alpha subunit